MFLGIDTTFEIYVGLVVILGTAAGVWIARLLRKSRNLQEVPTKKFVLTPREQEVLQLLSQGLSNAEIAERLFLSLSTVKTHVSALFVKMEVKNRAQAQEKANRLKIM
jgi:two-component system, NarL family, response regulator LiaR